MSYLFAILRARNKKPARGGLGVAERPERYDVDEDSVQGLEAEITKLQTRLNALQWAAVTNAPVQTFWQLEVTPAGVRITRLRDAGGGQWLERYGTVTPAVAAVYLAAITQGFEPPRGLVRPETPAEQTRSEPASRRAA